MVSNPVVQENVTEDKYLGNFISKWHILIGSALIGSALAAAGLFNLVLPSRIVFGVSVFIGMFSLFSTLRERYEMHGVFPGYEASVGGQETYSRSRITAERSLSVSAVAGMIYFFLAR